MRNIGFVLLAVSVLLGALTVLGLRHLGASRPTAPQTPQTTVVVATRPIGFGEVLTPDLLRIQAWPRDAKPQGSFETIGQLTAQRRVALGPIAGNEPVLITRISGPGGRATLSGVIRVGMRATTIRVNDVFGVAGFVLPGDFVDVLITRDEGTRSNANAQNKRTDVLLRSVRVLAVDQLANENKNDPVVAKAATIEVTPEQAQKLALAAEVGTLSLALRGTVDPLASGQDPAPVTVRTNDLRLDGVKPQPAPAKKPVRFITRPARGPAGAMIEIFRGSEASTARVPSVG
jgi:pilus assembly protein CpaB